VGKFSSTKFRENPFNSSRFVIGGSTDLHSEHRGSNESSVGKEQCVKHTVLERRASYRTGSLKLRGPRVV